MRTLLNVLLVAAVIFIPSTWAGDSPPAAEELPVDRLNAHSEFVYSGMKKILLRAAESLPEEKYAFRPTEEVRTFGGIVGHVADAQYAFCSAVLGEKNPTPKVEQTVTTKAELIAALEESFSYCDRAYGSVAGGASTQFVNFMGRDMPKLGVLNINQIHTIEHYGNLVTYLRMNTIVPPTSDPEFMRSMYD